MYGGTAVFCLDLCRQTGNVLHGAGLVVDRHAGHQNRVFVHRVDQLAHIQTAVGLGKDLHHGKAPVLQRPDGTLDTGVLEPGGDNLVAPGLPRNGRAQNGQVVALASAGGEIDLIPGAVQRFGNSAAGHRQLMLGQDGRLVQAGRIGPAVAHGVIDDIGHRRVHHGGGGVVQVVQIGVGSHDGKSLV